MNELVAIVFLVISIIVLLITVIVAVRTNRMRERRKNLLSSFHVLIIGVYLAVVCLFLPVYYTGYDFGETTAIFRPILISFHHALRVFILDGEFDFIRNAVSPLSAPTQLIFSGYAAILYVLSPVLTFGLVLSLFKNIQHERKFLRYRVPPCYIFSELNSRSIAIARSIWKNSGDERIMIVFADVFEKDEEKDYELMLMAHEMNAICLKKDITRLSIENKKKRVEFFLVGSDESENIEQAIWLTQKYKDCDDKAIAIYLYSSKPGAGYILDSLDKGLLALEPSLVRSIQEDPMAFLQDTKVKTERIDSGLYVRRIDIMENLAQKVLTEPEVLDHVFDPKTSEKTISVLILGMGSSGIEFLRNVLWLYQVDGYWLEINLVDASVASNGSHKSIRKKLGHLWPGIFDDPDKDSFVREESGFANYDIRVFEDIDCFTSDFDRLFRTGESAERLRRTQLAIVTLGDDDKNIEAAVSLRVLFDRLNGVTNRTLEDRKIQGCCAAESPLIYSVVYDEKKADNLNCNSEHGGLVNYKGYSYRINFVGSLQSQFAYDVIDAQKTLELEALTHHFDWLRKEEAKNADREGQHKEELAEKVLNEAKSYMDFEYFRKSSMASAKHFALLAHVAEKFRQQAADQENGRPFLDDASLPVTEHMRWDMYMMTQGYEYAGVRADRAKLHPDIVMRNVVDPDDQRKDQLG